MENRTDPWWGGGTYQLGDQPSPHVAGAGAKFLAKYRQNGPLADIGVWEGRNLPVLLSLGGEVVATDTTEAEFALAKTRQRYPQVSVHTAPLTALPFKSGELGGAVCHRVLHNITDPSKLVAAWAQLNYVLALDAPLVVAVRTEHHDDYLARCFVRRLPNGVGGMREDVYFTTGGLLLLSELMGFSVAYLLPDVEGGEVINGQAVNNHYLVAHLLKTALTHPSHLAVAERLIVRP